MARPRIEIDPVQFEELCELHCTLAEIARVLRCSDDTVERWCKRHYRIGFAEAFRKFSAGGKTSLRRSQFRLAEKNAAMAIWLGKQYLGQTDQTEVIHRAAEPMDPRAAAIALEEVTRATSDPRAKGSDQGDAA